MSLEKIVIIQEERRLRERKLFEDIYGRVEQKINNFVSMGSQACFYQIPNYIFGYPLLDIPKVKEYLLGRLNNVGFIAFPIDGYPDTIYISWELSALERRNMALRKRNNNKKSRITLEEEKEKRDDELIQALVSAKHRQNEQSRNK